MKRVKNVVLKAFFALCVSTSAPTAAPISGFGLPENDPLLIGGTVVGFENLPLGAFPSVTENGVTFTGDSQPVHVSGQFNGVGEDFNTVGAKSLYNFRGFRRVDITFDQQIGTVDAFAFRLGLPMEEWILEAFSSNGVLIEATVLPAIGGSSGGEYFGIEAPGVFSIAFRQPLGGPDDSVIIDNFTFLPTATVPIPTAFPLLLAALLGLGLFSWKRNAVI